MRFVIEHTRIYDPKVLVGRDRWGLVARSTFLMPAASDPRRPHHRFKLLAIRDALVEPAAFAARYASADRLDQLAELWVEANIAYPAGERVDPDGLAIEVHGEPASPVIFMSLPAPEHPNEAYRLAMIPTESVPLMFRVFALEKAVFPKTGEPLVFVIEIKRNARDNYGPPDNDAPNDASRGLFVTAILEICDGKRKPLGTVKSELVTRT